MTGLGFDDDDDDLVGLLPANVAREQKKGGEAAADEISGPHPPRGANRKVTWRGSPVSL
ncbi:MAG: hypothetical protein GWM92_16890 [Gemmatimonadetes bacterium]|nr:hypothetical protein [Gemmatimonadota bacterium]NIT89206.1 hypothetical protein [Gemmatimonadota bacterium]NIU33006.1 hypothetical protein [Gemmatimonadota bacterium]NIU37390.1 hypothetical protein [Gemmatimonadota bacterium]NIV63365.1 hypothetical protein [Gemmatimonadota bacterium]